MRVLGFDPREMHDAVSPRIYLIRHLQMKGSLGIMTLLILMIDVMTWRIHRDITNPWDAQRS